MRTADGKGCTDAYAVAKYGPKWARTRTILDHFNPRWNEQYAWDVFDPCTVLSIAVFDNARYKMVDAGKPPPKDARIGKLRIRLSTLDTNRVYSINYALTAVHPVGVRKMGELELAISRSCADGPDPAAACGSGTEVAFPVRRRGGDETTRSSLAVGSPPAGCSGGTSGWPPWPVPADGGGTTSPSGTTTSPPSLSIAGGSRSVSSGGGTGISGATVRRG